MFINLLLLKTGMKTLVVYYSRTGNTRKAAESIAKHLNADIDEIIDKKNRTRKIIGWLIAGKDASQKKLTEIEYEKNPDDYDLVIIGTPVWAWTMTPAIRTYLSKNKFKKVAFFCTSGGSPGKVLEHMRELSKKPLAKLSLVGREIDDSNKKIRKFCTKLQ